MASAGPLANDFDALAIFMKGVLDARPAKLDSTAIDVPWIPVDLSARPRLRFGILAGDPVFPLHPPVRNALAEAAELLRAAGHEVVLLTSEEGLVAPCYDVATQLFALDRTSMATVMRGGEPFVPSLASAREAMRQARFDRDVVPDTRSGTTTDGLERFATLNVKRAEFQEAWRRVWLERGLDAVIAPGASNTAVEHDQYGPAPYTALANFLDVSRRLQTIPEGVMCD